MTTNRYYAKEFVPGLWHIVMPGNQLVYDGSLDGKDKPLVFRDEDKAIAFARRCNENAEGGE